MLEVAAQRDLRMLWIQMNVEVLQDQRCQRRSQARGKRGVGTGSFPQLAGHGVRTPPVVLHASSLVDIMQDQCGSTLVSTYKGTVLQATQDAT